MIDYSEIEKYRENNRIEAKKALGGLPKSIWETYSAFANTMGGILLLGVEEYKDHSLHPVNLPNPDKMIDEFWELINNPQKVSVNILGEKHVKKHESDGKTFIAIEIPKAHRTDRPVYIDNNMLMGTYRRNGEGDYRCSQADVESMVRDAAVRTKDMDVLEEISLEMLCKESISEYRKCMELCRAGHPWTKLSDADLLIKTGGAGIGKDGKVCPTAAGLLMFGYKKEIKKVFPGFLLEYRGDETINGMNIFDFWCRVKSKMDGDTPMYKALREAVSNALMNADYYGTGGVIVKKGDRKIEISNPGRFRIDIEAASNGGVSDPRNAALMKMFAAIDVGEGLGGGIPCIYRVWKEQGFEPPKITETFNPDRITMTLKTTKNRKRRANIQPADKIRMIIEYLTDNPQASIKEIRELVETSAHEILNEMIEKNIIETDEKGNYRLKR